MTGAFLFGKLPAHGDFLARGLDAATRDALDHWLSASMRDAQEALGEGFAERYDAAPPWRFHVDGMAGAIAPSIDSAGRRFPILMGRPTGDAPSADAAACEAVIYAALGQRHTADITYAALDDAEGEGGNAPAAPAWWCPDADGAPVMQLEGARPAGLLLAMATVLEAAG